MKKPKVYFRNEQKKEKVTPSLRKQLTDIFARVLEDDGFDLQAEISVTFTDDENIKKLNALYRQKPTATDVLSFPMWERGAWEPEPDSKAVTLGDIVISLERTRAQANEFGHSFERECGFLAAHGLLHLLGYDHELSQEQQALMEERAEAALAAFGLVRE